MFLLFWNPLVYVLLGIAYVAGWLALVYLANKAAPRLAAIGNRIGLHAAMLLTALVVVAGGLAAIGGIYYAAAEAGYRLPLGFVLALAAAGNLLSYIAAPWIINMAYNARPDPELQEVVDEAAARAGVKPPRAMLVEGPPNAFAYGNPLAGRYVAVTRSLYEMLPREELVAVVGHELGHHRHRDVEIMLLLGLVPSVLYYMGVWLMNSAFYVGGGRDREERNGLVLAALGVAAVVLSFLMQVAVLAFSRLREYYADAHGAQVAGARNMQRALARLHLYYETRGREAVERSSLKALFIYALVEAAAAPLYSPWRSGRGYATDIDALVERLKHAEVDPTEEVLSDHPPIPKRLRFLDSLEAVNTRLG